MNWLRLPDGRHLGLHRDVTELKHGEIEIQRVRAVMQTVLDNLMDGVTLFDATGHVRYTNASSRRLHDLPASLLDPSATFADYVRHQIDRGAYRVASDRQAVLDDALARFAAADGQPKTRETGDGTWLETTFRRLEDGGTLVVHRNVTELKQQEVRAARERDAAEAANRAKSTFLAMMSHEIRTPMNGVLGLMDVLEYQGLAPAQRPIVETMRGSAADLLRIIDDVLDFSKIEAGRIELEAVPFSLSDLIHGATESFRPQAVAKALALSAEIDPGSADSVVGDPTRVRQVLFNLIGNAIKFTEAGRVQVRLGTSPLGAGRVRVSLAVCDTGIGMDADEQAKLFQPFAQADSSTTRRFGGTGIGLSIVRRLAQLMGGDVVIRSQAGQGAAFTVTLTLVAQPVPALPATVPGLHEGLQGGDAGIATDQPVIGRSRVLVVDDHPVNLEVLRRQLMLLGVDADAASDGPEALLLWQSGRYQAVLSDIHMPELDGYGLARAVREREACLVAGSPRVPIVAVTANAMRGEEERCRAAGMDAYLVKPVSLARLRAVLQRWLPLEPPASARPSRDAPAAIERTTLASWLGDDTVAIADLLGRFIGSAGTPCATSRPPSPAPSCLR